MRSTRRSALLPALLPVVLLSSTLLLTGCGASSTTHTAAQEKKVMAELTKIDAGFGGEDSLKDVKVICAEMQKNTADATVQADVKSRFSTHSIATLTTAQTKQIASTIKTDYCS